jgi:two-component system LytT family response regulator
MAVEQFPVTLLAVNTPDIRVLIVDDEPLGRDRLRNFLSQEAGVNVVGEATDGKEAVRLVRQLAPELVFLDIQMPGLNGFGVLEQLGAAVPPAVIFCTAHDEFALKAFEVHAVDYLLKPFDRDRFKTALGRAAERLQTSPRDELSAKLAAVLQQLQPTAPAALDRIPVKTNGRVIFISVPEIDWVGSADNYVELHVGTHSHLVRDTLTKMEQQLPPEKFLRISRTAIVNVDRVQELQPLFHGEYSVTLKTGVKLTLSRSHRDQLTRLGMK